MSCLRIAATSEYMPLGFYRTPCLADPQPRSRSMRSSSPWFRAVDELLHCALLGFDCDNGGEFLKHQLSPARDPITATTTPMWIKIFVFAYTVLSFKNEEAPAILHHSNVFFDLAKPRIMFEIKLPIISALYFALKIACFQTFSVTSSTKIVMNLYLKLTMVAYCLLTLQPLLYGQQAIEIHGTYAVTNFYPPKNTQVSASFTVVLDGQRWSIAATNADDPKDWNILVFDGTNTLCLSPTNRVKWRSLPALKDLEFVSISRDYDALVQSSIKIYIPWITYGLCPTNVSRNEVGLIDLPVPWMLPHRNLGAYGWKWVVEPTSDARFVDKCVVVRDSTLDLENPRDELLRPSFDYPANLDLFQEAEAQIRTRKVIPDGFTNCNYVCTEYTNIAGNIIPMEAIVSNFRPEGPGKLIQKAVLRANSFTLYDRPISLLPERMVPVLVQDYRYRKRKDDRVFQFAEYVLQPSSAWIGPDNAELKSKADNFVKFGRRFDDFGVWFSLSSKALVRWVILVVVLVPPCVMVWRSRNRARR